MTVTDILAKQAAVDKELICCVNHRHRKVSESVWIRNGTRAQVTEGGRVW